MSTAESARNAQRQCRLDVALWTNAERSAVTEALNCALLTACSRRASCLERVSELIEKVRSPLD